MKWQKIESRNELKCHHRFIFPVTLHFILAETDTVGSIVNTVNTPLPRFQFTLNSQLSLHKFIYSVSRCMTVQTALRQKEKKKDMSGF